MSVTWFTSDTHIGHKGILSSRMDRPRPFPTNEAHDEYVAAMWNYRVRDEDIVWHLGDFAYGGAMPIPGRSSTSCAAESISSSSTTRNRDSGSRGQPRRRRPARSTCRIPAWLAPRACGYPTTRTGHGPTGTGATSASAGIPMAACRERPDLVTSGSIAGDSDRSGCPR